MCIDPFPENEFFFFFLISPSYYLTFANPLERGPMASEVVVMQIDS